MQNRLIRIAFAAAMTTLGTAQLASATPITWIITGPVSSSTGSWSALFPVGTIANLSVTWEPDTLNPPDCPPGSGRYLAVKAAAAPLSILSYSAAYGGGAIEVNAPDGNCNPAAGTGVWFHLFQLSQAGPPGGFSFQLGIRVLGADPNAPTLPLIMAGVFGVAPIVVSGAGGSFTFHGPLEVVPEPATLVLVGMGLALAMARCRRRKP